MPRSILLLAVLGMAVLFAGTDGAFAQTDFKVCESTYALCTTAPCTPVPGKDGTLACACEVKTGYSLGLEACQEPQDSAAGRMVRSRYFPVTSYAVCTDDRPWAWCLDKPCVVDPTDPTKATCECTSTQKQGPYVIVTDTYTDQTCTTGIISSATVTQIDQATDFLKKSDVLKPFPITVMNPK